MSRSAHPARRSALGGWAAWWLIALLAWLPAAQGATDFAITELTCRNDGEMYRLDADIEYAFTDQVLEALQNGVRLTLEVHVQVREQGAWIWEEDSYSTRLRFTIHYHALAALYQVQDLRHDRREDFATLNAALSHLGRLRDLPLLPPDRLAPGSHYFARLKASLDVDALPLPLRPVGYLSPAWNLSSPWHSCRLNPSPPQGEQP